MYKHPFVMLAYLITQHFTGGNQLRDQFTERLESMATDNCARWVLSVVRRDLGFDDSHVVTMPEPVLVADS